MAARIAIVDDDASARAALARLLKAFGVETVAFSSAREFLDSRNAGNFGCAVIDLRMPDLDGLALQQELERTLPHLSVVFVSGQGDIPATVRAIKAGAVDFLEKPVSEDALLKAVESAGKRTVAMRNAYQELELLRGRYQTLTPREREVFGLITAGLLNKQAGAELGTTEKTIKVQRAGVMAKMAAGSLADLVRMAQQLGIEGRARKI
jgi:FixJ family two-component response regulator